MADIKTYLDKIQSAVYGEEVRGSIVNAITLMNNESSYAKSEATTAEEKARASAEAAKISEEKATQANAVASKINNMTVSAMKLESGENPTVIISDDGSKKHLSFGIPRGDTGDPGINAPQIDDTTASSENPWSGNKVLNEINNAALNVINDLGLRVVDGLLCVVYDG